MDTYFVNEARTLADFPVAVDSRPADVSKPAAFHDDKLVELHLVHSPADHTVAWLADNYSVDILVLK